MINTILQVRTSCFWKRLVSSYVVLIIIFSCLLFLFNLGKRDLWAPDEPRYAQVSKEMWENKDFILPHLNGNKYPDKPPILFWLIILFSIPFGAVTELSARLPSALAGIGCAITIYYFGKRLFSARVGFFAALILSTSIEYLTAARRVSFDGLLTFLITLSLFFFHTGYIRKEKKTKFFLFSYLLMAIATITKGPVGFAIPILIISTFLCVVKLNNYMKGHGQTNLAMPPSQIRIPQSAFQIRDMRIWLGCIIVFSIPLLWVFGIYLQGGWEHTKEVVFTQNIGRTVNSWSHKQPFYYFFIQFPLFFLPWSIFIPSVIIYYVKSLYTSSFKLYSGYSPVNTYGNFQHSQNTQSTLHVLQPETRNLQLATLNSGTSIPNLQSSFLFPAVWFIVIFTFFSFMSGKRSGYILPLYPAASLFVAWFLDSFISSASDKRYRKLRYIPFKIVYGILISIGLFSPGWAYYYHYTYFMPVLLISIIIICGAIISNRYLSKRKPSKALASSFIVFLITVMLCTQIVIPIINEKKSARYFCEKVNRIIGPDGKFASLNFFRSTYLFYTGKKSIEVITDIERLNEYFGSDERIYLLLKEKTLETVKMGIDTEVYPLVNGAIGHRTMVLISNKQYPD